MRIQHNIAALNSYRQLGTNNSNVAKNLEKLSSGYKINKAGDDAAGLSISEKMRAQITGLETAQANAQDGISLIQTAEGNLQEVHSMLNRMVELATQSANGTYSEFNREQLQKEINSLNEEVDRIAQSANFNGLKLLDGSLSSVSTPSDAGAKQLMDIQTRVNAGNVTAGRVDAQAANHKFSAASLSFANDEFDAMEITFKNAKGETKTIKLVEGAVTGSGISGTTIAASLSGASGGLALAPAGGSEKDLAEFRELFDIKVASDATGGDGISIKAKDANSQADLISLKVGGAATSPNDGLAALAVVVEDGASTKAEKAGYAIDLNSNAIVGTSSNIAANDSVKIGDTTYQFIANSGDPTVGGAIGVVLGSNDGDAAKNLAAQLRLDGYDVKVSDNDANKIIFNGVDQLKEKQGGSQISSSNNSLEITKQQAVKEKTEVQLGGAAAGGSQSFVFNYVDEKGKAQSKTISYTGTTNGGNADEDAKAITAAIKNDSELVKLFDVSVDNAGKITIEARGTGAGAGSFTGIQISDATTTQSQSRVAGQDLGKTIGMKGTENMKVGDTVTVDGVTYEFSKDSSVAVGSGNVRVDIGATGGDTMKNLSDKLKEAGVKHTFDSVNHRLSFADKDAPDVKSGGLTLQVGDTNETYQKVTVSIGNMDAKSLNLSNIDISSQPGAAAAITAINAAIDAVSATRGDLGALQNRLDHTINNLGVATENMTAAESRIRDTDMAKEMMDFTKNNILTQAAQAMLAQANTIPQGVLQLLQ